MSNSGNPSGALGDSGQQPGVSENSESHTVPPPVNDPNVLAFQRLPSMALLAAWVLGWDWITRGALGKPTMFR